ncbi:MAG: phosphatidate cytidylyltransferase [Phycisphaerae bacterium]|nr:phosphatidate cytidylyltransferase [Phycisphaerae bacterium]
MVKRIVFGVVMAAAALAVIWLEYFISRTGPSAETSNEFLLGLPTLAVLAALLVVGFFEIGGMARFAGTRLLTPMGIAGTLLIVAWPKLVLLARQAAELQNESSFIGSILRGIDGSFLLLVGLVIGGVFLNQMVTRRAEGALLRIASTLLAVTYLGVGGAMVLSLRLDYGLGTLLVFLGAVKLTDVGAYFVGSLLGKHKLVPWLSPGKSWEGLLGGLVTAAAAGLAVCGVRNQFAWMSLPLANGEVIAFCLILGLAGQFGDLCESLLKRSAGVKDAGNLVPQFGGVLDILDSLLIAAPVAHVLLLILA